MQVAKNSKKLIQNALKCSKIISQINPESYLLNMNTSIAEKSFVFRSQRAFAEEIQLEKISSFDNLNYRIANASNASELLSTYEQNALIYKNENIVNSLRVLSKIIRSSPQHQIESLPQDKRYHGLIEEVVSRLEQFSENEIMDLLFWLRRFKVLRINSVISEENIERIYQKAKDFVKSNSYPFKNLVHIFYNASYLNRNTEEIVNEIMIQIRKSDKILTPSIVAEILQGCARIDKYIHPKEYILLDQIQKIIPLILKDADIDQKASIFKYLAALELHLNPPRYRIPPVLYIIKNSLKESIHQLEEAQVLAIIDAYRDLPKEFHADLFEEIKEMFIVTIQHNSSQIKSFFLLEFLDKITQVLRFKRLTEERLRFAFDEVAKRLPEDNYLSKYRHIEKIIEVYDRVGIKHQQLIQKTYDTVLGFSDSFFSGPVLQCFTNHDLDISPFLDKYVESKYFSKKGDLQALRLFIVISGLKGEKYQSIKNDLKTQFLSNTGDLHKFVSLIASSEIENKELTELLTTIIQSFRSNKESINDSAFYKAMIHSVISHDLKNNWRNWAKENLKDLTSIQLQRLTDVVFSISDLTQDQFQLYSYILQINKPENIPLKKILIGLKDSKKLLWELSKLENYLENFLEKILTWMDIKKNDVKISVVYGLVKRIESTGLILPVTTLLLRKAYIISKELNFANTLSIEVVVTLYLLEKGALRKEDAHAFYDKCKDNMNDAILLSKYLSYILQRLPPKDELYKTLTEEAQEKIDLLQKQLTETNSRTVLTSLAAILAFPPQFWKNKREYLTKVMKEFIGIGNAQLYIELLNALPSRSVKFEQDLYIPFLKEFTSNYSHFKKKFSTSDIVTILERMTDFNYKNIVIYNLLLGDIGKHFGFFRREEYFDMITAFTKIGIKQGDLFDKILAKVDSQPKGYSNNLRYILLNLFKVGHNSQQAKAIIPRLFTKRSPTKTQEILPFLVYLPVLELHPKEELALFEKYTNLLEPKEIHFQLSPFMNLYDYLRFAYKDRPELAEKLKSIFPDFDNEYKNAQSTSDSKLKIKKLIASYLKVMNVESEDNFSIDGFNVDLYIPSQKIIMKIYTYSDLTFDKKSLTGKGIITKKLYERFKDYKPVFLSIGEFRNISTEINKINYITSKGVENHNTKGVYDFSQIHKVDDFQVEEKDEGNQVEEISKFLDEEKIKKERENEKEEDI